MMPYARPIYISNSPAFYPVDGPQSVLWCSAPSFSSPIPNNTSTLVLTQKFMCRAENFDSLSLELNSPHPWPEFENFILCNEGDRQDVGGGCVEWTRTYVFKNLPSYEEPTNISYQFIGYNPGFGTISGGVLTGRSPFAQTVPCTIVYDFFVVGPGYIPTFQDIPVIPAQRYVITGTDVDWPYIGNPGTISGESSTPSIEEYEYLISSGQSIVAQDSVLERWMGNIFRRASYYIKPQ